MYMQRLLLARFGMQLYSNTVKNISCICQSSVSIVNIIQRPQRRPVPDTFKPEEVVQF